MQPSVSFVIPTFRRPDALRATLDAVLAVEYPPGLCEVIVVDNAADAATEAVVRGYAGVAIPVRYVAESRGGSATARNQGARVATGELLILLDDDILVMPILAVVREAALAGPRLAQKRDRLLVALLGFLHRNAEAVELAPAIAFADTEIESPIGEEIQRRRLLGQ